jgi:5-methylcytosine-specific restriction endonuclease McrA
MACNTRLEAIQRYEERTNRFGDKPRKKIYRGSHTRRQWEALKEKYGYACPGCGCKGKLTKDHAISRDYGRQHDVPWLDSIDNIQPLCPECNCKKGNGSFSYWRDSSGKIIVRR